MTAVAAEGPSNATARTAGRVIAHVTQDVERQLIRLRSRKRLLWKLWRDRYEPGAKRRNLRQDRLTGSQLDIAIGAPAPR
jgi:hypothetical protein